MTKIYMVRHGQAVSGWDGDIDPGLSPLGWEQAEAAAGKLAPIGPIRIISSPMIRARETSEPLCKLWQSKAQLDSRFTEIPSPDLDFANRGTWLHEVMKDRWANLDPGLQIWRRTMIDAIRSMTEDTIIFSHFIAINVLTGEALKDDCVVNFYPDNGSITILEISEPGLSLLEKGKEAGTIIR